MDHQSQAEAFEVLPPATAQRESWNEYEYEQEGPSAQGEFEDEVFRVHRSGGAPVHAAWGGHRVSAPFNRRATVSVHGSSWPGVHGVYRTHNAYGGSGTRYGWPGYYGASGYSGASPSTYGGQWGRWPRWYRGRWPVQGWGWDGGGMPPPEGDDGDDYPPQPMPMPMPVMTAPPPAAPDVPPQPMAAYAPAPAAPAPAPTPPDAATAPPAGASSEFEFGFGSGFGSGRHGRGHGHHRHCDCSSCMGGSPFGGFAQQDEVGGGPAPARPACASYTPGEVQRSTSAAGLLRASVLDHPRGTVVADFGVNWRTPRDSLARDPALGARLRQWLDIARADPTMRMRVLGFSDCVGDERDNLFLRKGRATRLMALLERMVGKPSFDALRSRIVAVDAAPIGDFLGSNDTVEGRAVNRGVLFEFQRQVHGDPIAVAACSPNPADLLRYPLLLKVPNVPDYRPLPIEFRIDAKKMVGDLAQDLHGLGEKAAVLMEAAHWGIASVEIFELISATSALAGVLAVLGPVLAWTSGFVALGAPYVEAAKEIAARHAASGFSIGLVMGASGASFRKMREYFGNTTFPPNDFFPQGRAIATANYRAGLVAGFAQARALCPAQRAVVMRDIGRRMGDQSYRGDQARWGDKERIDWFIAAAATFNAAHLEH